MDLQRKDHIIALTRPKENKHRAQFVQFDGGIIYTIYRANNLRHQAHSFRVDFESVN